jgi:hypothetical protein
MIAEFGNVKAVAGAIAAGGFHLQNPQSMATFAVAAAML